MVVIARRNVLVGLSVGVSAMVREAFSRTPGLVLIDMPGWVVMVVLS